MELNEIREEKTTLIPNQRGPRVPRDNAIPVSQWLPVGHARLVQCHEVDLAGGAALGAREEHLIVALAEELEALRLLVHEHAVQVAGLHGADLNGLVAPAHDLAGADVGHGRRHLAPL